MFCSKKKTGRHCYLATREAIEDQQCLPGTQDEKQYPFQTITTNGRKYKVFGIVTNRDVNGNEINWLHERCGESEEVHRAMKDDFAGGKLPSGGFGQNAAWWWNFWRSILMRGKARTGLGTEYHHPSVRSVEYTMQSPRDRRIKRASDVEDAQVRPRGSLCLDSSTAAQILPAALLRLKMTVGTAVDLGAHFVLTFPLWRSRERKPVMEPGTYKDEEETIEQEAGIS